WELGRRRWPRAWPEHSHSLCVCADASRLGQGLGRQRHMQGVQAARCKNVPTLATSAYAAFQPGGTHGKPRYMAHARCLPMAVPRTPLAQLAVAYPHKGEHMPGITALTLNGTEVV